MFVVRFPYLLVVDVEVFLDDLADVDFDGLVLLDAEGYIDDQHN